MEAFKHHNGGGGEKGVEKDKGKRGDEKKIQDSLVVVEVMMVNFTLVPTPLVFFP